MSDGWEMPLCVWCRKVHVKYPKACVQSALRIAKKYKEPRPKWVVQLIQDVNEYVEPFKSYGAK